MSGADSAGEFIDGQEPASPEVRRLRREVARLGKELRSYQTSEALIVDAVAQAIEDIPIDMELPRMPPPGRSSQSETAVLHLSDIHYGLGTGTYGRAIAEERLARVIEKVIKVTKMRRTAARVDRIHVYLGGDLVEGENIRPGQAYEITQSVFEQAVMGLPQVLARLVLRLLSEFRRVHVVAVPGNHGRSGRFHGEQNPRTNWDRVVARVLEMLLTSSAKRARDKHRLTFAHAELDEVFAVDRVYDWGCLLFHGDVVRGGFAGMPLYGVWRKLAGWATSQEMPPWDYAFFGHFHSAASQTINRICWLANGTLVSGDMYAKNALAAESPPCQRLVFMDADHGVLTDHLIYPAGGRLPAKRRAEEWLEEGKK